MSMYIVYCIEDNDKDNVVRAQDQDPKQKRDTN